MSLLKGDGYRCFSRTKSSISQNLFSAIPSAYGYCIIGSGNSQRVARLPLWDRRVWLPQTIKTSASCHCERSEAISRPIRGLLRRLRRLAMTRMGRVEEFKFPEGKIHYLHMTRETPIKTGEQGQPVRGELFIRFVPGLFALSFSPYGPLRRARRWA
jgi:hypothetical protein